MKKRRTFCRYLRLSIVSVYMFIFILLSSVFFLISNSIRPSDLKLDKVRTVVGNYQRGYIINNKGCKIPDLPITNKHMEKYFEKIHTEPNCNNGTAPLVDANLTSLFFLEESFESYNITERNFLRCCYEELKRRDPFLGERDKQYEYGNKCVYFDDTTNIEEEFVHVKCTYECKLIYEDFFAFVPKKAEPKGVETEKMNVLVIGLDGVSRLNLHRQMGKTVDTLKNLGFQEFLGYNKIADNTHPNLIAVLTGKNEHTILKTCRKYSKYYDNCSFIWDGFKKNGFMTSFAEDSASIGVFNIERYGFKKQPTDYMWGVFNRVSEDIIGNSNDMSVVHCIGARETYKMLLRYTNSFVERMRQWNQPYFFFSWSSSLSHDHLNRPKLGDQFYSDFFRVMYENGYFENTIVIFMSDHGMRFGTFRETYQGRIEERLPFLYVKLPSEFEERFPSASSNLRKNLKKLVTPFDVYETLQVLTTLESLGILAEEEKEMSEYGQSLFEEIPSSRTCNTAGVPSHWCTCLHSRSISITREVAKVANLTVGFINDLLKGQPRCARLKLKTVRNSEELFLSNNKVRVKDFILVSFETEPGGGFFEATVKQRVDGGVEIVGVVSRLNIYGNDSACVSDPHLKLYCFCTN